MDFELNLLADLETSSEYVRGVLWTILFHRLLGCVQPSQGSFYGVTYPTVNNPELEELVEAKTQAIVDAFSYEIAHTSTDQDSNMIFKGVMVLKFYDRKVEQNGRHSNGSSVPNSRSHSQSSSISFQPKIDKFANCWERWILKISILKNVNLMLDGPTKLETYKQDFEKNMFAILNYADTNKSHIPPITRVEQAPFPFKVLFALNTHEPHTLNRAFRNFEISDTESEELVDYSMESLPDTNERNRNAYNGQEMLKTGYKFIKKLLE
ncbi:hypothetical protein OGAPHI_007462 [Ogataea philodendri]|uniref:Autophagy-related protein 101 n=1 Tax=Ogataea philodendri TaxID=1378263 RepID=A0A9P8NV72_9ASCO|nr:uncharacterized protein OGAPHI_007462 [Ogataea philodendri]KAH3660257.1 hypothetical protein OGAPHI_007462 [Ogataea philodendri]